MRASEHHAPPQPLPLPLPLPPPPLSLPTSPPAAPRRRGLHRSSHSSSSSSSSSISSAASTFFCPSPSSPASSPRASSSSTTSSLVPFAWERHPGVPKNSFRGGVAASPTAGTPLPLPPPLLRQGGPRLRRRRRRAKAPAASSSAYDARVDDPFVAAFAECTRDGDDDDDDDYAGDSRKLWPVPAKPAVGSSGRAEHRWWISGGLVAFLDMHGCKSAMDAVADGAFVHPRRRLVAAAANPPRPRGRSRR